MSALTELLRKCREYDEEHGITPADRRHHLAEHDHRAEMWNAMTPEQRDRILRGARPDVSDYVKRQHDGPSAGLMYALVVAAPIVAVLVGLLVGM